MICPTFNKKGAQSKKINTIHRFIENIGNHQAPFYKQNPLFPEPLTLMSGLLQCKEADLKPCLFLIDLEEGHLKHEMFTRLGEIICETVLSSMKKTLFHFFRETASHIQERQFEAVWESLTSPPSIANRQTFKTGKQELIGVWRHRMISFSDYHKAASRQLFPTFDEQVFFAWLQGDPTLVSCLKKNQIEPKEVAEHILSTLGSYDTVW